MLRLSIKQIVFTGFLLFLIYCQETAGKNIAFRRAFYQSSAIDFDATGHLVTDGSQVLDSRWISKTNQNEWIYVDLGAESQIRTIILYWDNPAVRYNIAVSDDAVNWKTVFEQTAGKGGKEICPVKSKKVRYVRLYCIEGNENPFSLIEMEIDGTNRLVYFPEKQPQALADGTQYLRGGNWRLQRASEVNKEGIQLSQSRFDDSNWLPAKVPGTVLTSYLLAGAIPDPDYGAQQTFISDRFFTADFWYRNTFKIPASQKGKTTWLNFDAINWKADVYFNGHNLGSIHGAFIRKNFDITEYANYGGENYLAVLIHKNDTPGKVTLQTKDWAGHNGGLLGADNPTIHASVGWDWLPTIRGRNIGIYNDVYLSYTQDIQLRDPWITVNLDVENKDFKKARLTVKTELHNPAKEIRQVYVKGRIQPANVEFQSPVFTLQANETREVTVVEVILEHPHLWWPNTYGEQFLYTAELSAYSSENRLSDTKTFDFGVRQFTYDTNNPLTIYCNGARIICRGGNWGMDDGNLAATENDYDTKIRLHAEANLTMIRNWVGMTRNDAFYRACDKYGILIWDDFWLANPGDGPNPNDEDMFMQNARDKVKRIRRYASPALYCGRNEGNPPESLNQALNACTAELDGTRHYIPHSAAGVVSGWGPYSVRESEWYFQNTAKTLHSERGMPNIPALESMERMLPPEHRWPINDVWGIHDFTQEGAQHGKMFLKQMQRYGSFNDLPSFVRTAQMVNYAGHQAMFEAIYTNRSNGMLMWMSQSAWPSMVWQTYDYYYDTNAGYFAIKKANQPVNLIYNPATLELVFVNATAEEKNNLQLNTGVFDINGKSVHSESFIQSIPADSARIISRLSLNNLPSGIYFIQTKIMNPDGKEIAGNFTWISTNAENNYTELSQLAEAGLQVSYEKSAKQAGHYTLRLTNQGNNPALMIRIKVRDKKTNRQILPVYYTDNYISLMPGETKTIDAEISGSSAQTENIDFYVEAWNLKTRKI